MSESPDQSPQADVFAAIRVMAEQHITNANTIADEVASSRVNVGKVVSEIRKESDDPAVVKYRERADKIEAELDRMAKEIEADIKARLVPTSKMSEEVYEAKKLEWKELKKKADNTLKLAKDLPGYEEKYFEGVTPVKTLAGGTVGTTSGTKRPRLAFLSIDGAECFTMKKKEDGTEEKSYTFTNAALVISKAAKVKVSPSDLSAAAMEAAKTDDLSTVNEVEFSYSVNGQGYMIKANPAQASTKE